jgi:hypothetical protein
MTSWLAARYGMAWGTAREWVRVAHRARDLPWIAEAHASLPAEEGSALESAVARRAEGVPRDAEALAPAGARLADALVDMAAGGPEPATVVVHAAAEILSGQEPDHAPWLAETNGGHRLTSESIRRLACDRRIEWVLERAGRPVGIGRRGRRVPGSLDRVLRLGTEGGAGSRGADGSGGSMPTTWSTGPTAGRRTWTTWSCCATPTTG